MEANLPQRRLHLGSPVSGGEIVKRRVILEGFTHSEKGVVTSPLGDVSKAWRQVMPGDLLAEPADRSTVGSQQSSKAQQERGLAGTGPAYEPDDLACRHVEIDIAQRGCRHGARSRAGVVRLIEPPDRQRQLHRLPLGKMSIHDCSSLQTQSNRCRAGGSNAPRVA